MGVRPDYEALPTPATPRSGEALMSLLDRIKKVPNDEASSQHKARLQQKVANAAQTYIATIALLRSRNQFLARINNEGKARRAADQKVIGTARVVTYEDLEKKRAERAVMDAKAAEKMAKKAAKEASNVASAAPEAQGAATGMKKRGRKRESAASVTDAAAPKAKAPRPSEEQHVPEAEQDVTAPEPTDKAARMSDGLALPPSTATFAEDGAAIKPWRALVARMW
ncbi:uncharacterized protein M421DRAFT_57919 [Didymella exigua CBS 183.55]|uniref:Uncharacterized protein n=1 Tax=Didymella exigua CBS 183.55 TaxID=1150837 RepID=A0A6A5RU44_9PLEO|nr:uncharacterized protein M421DRAFT_57919 [Didymella exigua CBS 183.55]KAF1930993.1 hypothetical protein M421DRAFT_57919 [Didymella exigua CBS 183.55]